MMCRVSYCPEEVAVCTQHTHIVMWEPSDPGSPEPFEFVWTRNPWIAETLRSGVLDRVPAGTTVYSATLPLPTDGDFATANGLQRSLARILEGWPRNAMPPASQTIDATVVHT